MKKRQEILHNNHSWLSLNSPKRSGTIIELSPSFSVDNLDTINENDNQKLKEKQTYNNNKILNKRPNFNDPARRWSTPEIAGKSKPHHLPSLNRNKSTLNNHNPMKSFYKQQTNLSMLNRQSTFDDLLTVDSYLSGKKETIPIKKKEIVQSPIHEESKTNEEDKNISNSNDKNDTNIPDVNIKSHDINTIEEQNLETDEVEISTAKEDVNETAINENFKNLFDLRLIDLQNALLRKKERKRLLLNKEISRLEMKVLIGNYKKLPNLPTGQVRLYMSATCSDMKTERLAILKASEKVNLVCRRVGIDFYIVDLRWAITPDAKNDQNLTDLMKNELRRCQRLSIGHHFVCLLGNKYGYRPLPSQICENHWNIIKKYCDDKSFENWNILKEWYCLDENNEPPVYVLQPINTKFQYFLDNDAENSDLRDRDRKLWETTYINIRQLLVMVSSLAKASNLFDDEIRRSYVGSMTDIELNMGIFENESKIQRCMIYDRTVKGLKTVENQSYISCYLDTLNVDGKTIQDWEATDSIRDLKNRTSASLKGHNYRCYVTEFRNQILQLAGEKGRANYIADYTSDFINDCTEFIDNCVEPKYLSSQKNVEFNEILHHSVLCEDLFKKAIIERVEVLDRVKQYLLSDKLKDGEITTALAKRPLIIYGESGIGKSCICAQISKNIFNWFNNDNDHLVLINRFISTSLFSGNIIQLLDSVCYQLSAILKIPMPDLELKSVKNLSDLFLTLINKLVSESEKTLVIILDGIDEMNEEDESNDEFNLDWLPKWNQLRPNVFIILTFSDGIGSNGGRIIKALNDKMTDNENEGGAAEDENFCDNFIKVDKLSISNGKLLMNDCLAEKHRKLTRQQSEIIEMAINNCSNPLYLKLLFDETIMLKSYNSLNIRDIASNIRLAIGNLLKNLENRYGRETIKYVLSYITVCRGGITDVELEDLLSCNDIVLQEIYKDDLQPPFQRYIRMPTLHWLRIRNHIDNYLLETQSDGKLTLTWFHKEFKKVIHDKYLKACNFQEIIHQQITDMFLNDNGEVKRTIQLRNGQVITNADRLVRIQRTIPGNRRKLNCLPYHLLRCRNIKDDYLTMAKRSMFFSLSWILAKFLAYSIDDIIRDINDYLTVNYDEELRLLNESLTECKQCDNVDLDPAAIPAFLYKTLHVHVQLTMMDNDLPFVKLLVKECEKWIIAGEKLRTL